MNVNLLAAALMCIGLYGVLTRKDLVAVLACVEIMLGAANLQLVASGSVLQAAGRANAQVIALVVLVLAAAEAAVGLGLALAAYSRTRRVRMDEFSEVRG